MAIRVSRSWFARPAYQTDPIGSHVGPANWRSPTLLQDVSLTFRERWTQFIGQPQETAGICTRSHADCELLRLLRNTTPYRLKQPNELPDAAKESISKTSGEECVMIQTNEIVGVLLTPHYHCWSDQRNQQQPLRRTIPWSGSNRDLVNSTPMRQKRSLDLLFSLADGAVSDVGQWRMADVSSNVARSLHPRRQCNRRRIQYDGLLWRADRAWHEFPHVWRYQADLGH